MKEGGKKWMMDVATIYMRKLLRPNVLLLYKGTYLLDLCGSINYDVIINWRSKTKRRRRNM
jgi:hypothetical protein